MSDPQTFFNFLDWSMKNYPAKNVVLSVSGHGSGVMSWGGPTGVNDAKSYEDVVIDVNPFDPFIGIETNGDSLSIFEFKRVLQEIKKKYPETKIQVLILDACLSQATEVLSDLKGMTRIVMGSPYTVPGTGMHYGAVAEAINQNMSPVKMSEHIGNAFIHSVETDNLLSIYDLEKMENFEEKLDNFCDALIIAMGDRKKTRFKNLLNFYEDYWDIQKLASSIIDGTTEVSNNANLVEASQALIKAQLDMAINSYTKGKWTGSYGLSIFWPGEDNYRKYRDFYKKLTFSKEHRWDEFLDRFIFNKKIKIFNKLYSE
ncbi:MAG: hypothetical protein COB02_13655 [Candidatus Cloacimonadota bacterium]|nr:MAG: hypothetical protein COB02_13655 [Candidatus Cloacimonadota bacterium]